MAARLSLDEVLEAVLEDNSDDDQPVESNEEINEDKEKLSNSLDSFDGGNGFLKDFFKENAISVLMPLVQACKQSDDLDERPQRLEAAKLLSITNINAGSLLMEESRAWLSMIDKRLAGKVSIRRPYYAEIHRCIPHNIFVVLKCVLRNSDDDAFKEPRCYMRSNSKAEVISFTSICSLQKFLSFLSVWSTREVKKFFSRILTSSSRSGNKVKVLVSETKDFGFFYKKSLGRLTLQFYYGE